LKEVILPCIVRVVLDRKNLGNEDNRSLIEQKIKYIFEDPDAFASKVLATYERNIIKYAYRGKKQGRLLVSVKKTDQTVAFLVQDDGNGLPEDHPYEFKEGFGFMLVRLLAEQLNGTLKVKSQQGKGTTVTLSFTL